MAAALGVCEKTLRRWAERGRIPVITLPSGHRRFDAAAVAAALREKGATVTPELARLAGEVVWTLADHAGVRHAMSPRGDGDFLICAMSPAKCCGTVLSGNAALGAPTCPAWRATPEAAA